MIETIVTTSVLIVALVILRKLWKGRISFRLQYALWLLVAVRLLVPLPVMESALSIMNFMLPVVEQAEEFGARKIGASDKVYEEPLVSGMPEAPTEQIVPKGNIFRPANDSISETVIGSDTVTDSSDHQNPAEIQENLPVVETSPFTW